jgi:hypothetical protein
LLAGVLAGSAGAAAQTGSVNLRNFHSNGQRRKETTSDTVEIGPARALSSAVLETAGPLTAPALKYLQYIYVSHT